MIQRIQTIFLLLAGGAFAALILFPFATRAQGAEAIQGVFADGKYEILDDLILEVLTAAGVLLSLINIFLFKNRSLQIRVCYLMIVMSVLMLGLVFMKLINLPAAGSPAGADLGWFMPAVAVICTVSAIYYIKKDDKLIESMDRLR